MSERGLARLGLVSLERVSGWRAASLMIHDWEEIDWNLVRGESSPCREGP